jgi:methylenetetrahydrofolate dehydrogenase (NADP+)/methenyltetrahydrofolate cyclohydrolase
VTKLLNGAELAGFIKERHAKDVRSLHGSKIIPKLAIIRTNQDPVVDTYMRLKTTYGEDIGAAVVVHDVEQAKVVELIGQLNQDDSVHGIIVQLPLPDKTQTEEVLNSVSPDKDVDGLGAQTKFDAATPTAINWLLTGYGVDLKGKKIIIVGQGRLVGRPLLKMFQDSGLDVQGADKSTQNLSELTRSADILISATGNPGLVSADMIKQGAVVVDAGASTDSNGLVGDVAEDVRRRDDLTITPETGGVGPLTVCALFENVLTAAKNAG